MNSRQFTVATPKQKAVMITDGVEYMAWRMHKLAAELKALNQWINQVPDLKKRGEAIPLGEEFQFARDQYLDARDKFLDRVLQHDEEIKKLEHYLFKQTI